MWEKVLELTVAVGATLTSLKLLLMIASQDKEAEDYFLHVTFRLGLIGFLSGELVFWCGSRHFPWGNGGKLFPELMVCAALGILAGCLLMACVTDCQNCMVYHYVWWVGGMAGIFLWELSCYHTGSLELSAKVIFDSILPVIFFGLLQKKLFSKMYGKADCYAFTVCAVAECGFGFGMKEYLVHMLLAILLLTVVQGLRGNIGKKGNLKESVAFLPYITISFWGLLLIMG